MNITRYDVTLGWVGQTAKIVTVPSSLGPEAARRRAFFALASQSPARAISDLVVVSVVQVRPCGNCGHTDPHRGYECPACECEEFDSGLTDEQKAAGLCRWCNLPAHTGVCSE